jgi:hypothetical protein
MVISGDRKCTSVFISPAEVRGFHYNYRNYCIIGDSGFFHFRLDLFIIEGNTGLPAGRFPTECSSVIIAVRDVSKLSDKLLTSYKYSDPTVERKG